MPTTEEQLAPLIAGLVNDVRFAAEVSGKVHGYGQALNIAMTVYQETREPVAGRIVIEILENMKLDLPEAFK